MSSFQDSRRLAMGTRPDTDVTVKASSYSIASGQQLKELGVITVMGAVAGMLVGCLLGLTVFKWKDETKEEYYSRTKCPPECITNPNCKMPSMSSHIAYYVIVGVLGGLSATVVGFTVYILFTNLMFLSDTQANARRIQAALTKRQEGIFKVKQ